MKVHNVAIVVNGLGEHWLGGVHYFRNLVAVFDSAADPSLHLHLLTDDPRFLGDVRLSARVTVHTLALLQRHTPAWALRKALQVCTGRDSRLVAKLKELGVKAVLFKYVPGAGARGIPTLPWIPDFQSQHHPELFPPSHAAAERSNAALYVRCADGLIVSSQSAANDAVNLFAADPGRLHVLRFAPKIDFEPLVSTVLRDEVFARHGIDRPYLFLPNQYWQHKNHRLVAEALSSLRRQGLAAPLVISTGKTEDPRSPSYFAGFETYVRAQGIGDDYRVLGVIERQDMMVLMAHSMAVVNPSRFEGWSTTVEEAKALGKPLLVSDIAVHREQIAEVSDSWIFGTTDVDALADRFKTLTERHGSSRAIDHPPHPNPALFERFTGQYIALIKRLAAVDHPTDSQGVLQ